MTDTQGKEFEIIKWTDSDADTCDTLETCRGEAAVVAAFRDRVRKVTDPADHAIYQKANGRRREDLEEKAFEEIEPEKFAASKFYYKLPDDLLTLIRELRETKVHPDEQELDDLAEKLTSALSQAASEEEAAKIMRALRNELWFFDAFDENDGATNPDAAFHEIKARIYELVIQRLVMRPQLASHTGTPRN